MNTRYFYLATILVFLISCGGGADGDAPPPTNIPPVANAGPDQNVNSGDTVMLIGDNSTDSDGSIVSYKWTQTSGASVALDDDTSSQTQFVANPISEYLEFQLVVTDNNGATNSDTITVIVNHNISPTANAGNDITVETNSIVSLDGSGSSDVDGNITSYSWFQYSGTSVSISNADQATSSFTAPSTSGTLVFELMVVDDNGAVDSDRVTVTVENSVVGVVGLDARPNNMNCVAPNSPGSNPGSLELANVFSNWNMPNFPMGMYQLPYTDAYFYVITRDGRVLRYNNDSADTDPIVVLDISARVDEFNSHPPAAEGGLLGFAFHPEVETNGAVYIYYTRYDGSDGFSRIARFTMTDESNIDPNSEVIVLEVEQPYGNHNGGDIHFGPDGYLYIGLGDGGSANDPLDAGQDTSTLLGAMLRINVDPTTTNSPFYSIPNDNPFAIGGSMAGQGALEIYAWGLRNPFRWSFDRGDGKLWLADVGQTAREEIDLIVNGGNYGWNLMEGSICNTSDCSSFVAPIHDYNRTIGNSITGGYVYRGTEIPDLDGVYVFGDYGSGSIFTLTKNGTSYERASVASASNIVAFAQDNKGEIYVLTAFSDRTIRKLQPASSSTSNIPDLLSETGCFDSTNPSVPNAGLIPYSVINPLWSDGAEKNRWIAIPNGESIAVDSDGDFDFPIGTVLAKNFQNNSVMIETRLLMRHQSAWAGYSYKWRDDQSDADLLTGADDDTVLNSGLSWHFPSRGECNQCHTQIKNFALGPEISQLNHDYLYQQTMRTANQVYTLDQIGMFSTNIDPAMTGLTLYALDDTSASLQQRAKSYLHSNCSQCHQPGGTGEGNIDFRFETSLTSMNICNIAPQQNFGNPDSRYIVPGSPSNSMILTRMKASVASGNRMPPLATSVVDSEAVTLLTEWINSLSSCP